MSGEGWKAIATSIIWMSTAVILTFGLFKTNGGSQEWLFIMTAMILGAGLIATMIVWKSGSGREELVRRGFEVVTPEAGASYR